MNWAAIGRWAPFVVIVGFVPMVLLLNGFYREAFNNIRHGRWTWIFGILYSGGWFVVAILTIVIAGWVGKMT